MADRGRGGYRKPSRPAAVSAPQSGARTDGGPADKQPIRTPTGGAYGEASALNQQQAGAPMAAGGPSPVAGGGVPPSPDMGMEGGGFGPTQRPNESPMAGARPEDIPDAQMFLRELYRRYPSPWIAGMLNAR